jgi:predicted nucleotidyltransferase
LNCAVNINREQLGQFCRRWKIVEFALFGSILRADFRSDSDVDCLVRFAPEATWTLFDMARMQEELESVFGRAVHLVSRRGLESSRNYLRREAILSSAEVVDVT